MLVWCVLVVLSLWHLLLGWWVHCDQKPLPLGCCGALLGKERCGALPGKERCGALLGKERCGALPGKERCGALPGKECCGPGMQLMLSAVRPGV